MKQEPLSLNLVKIIIVLIIFICFILGVAVEYLATKPRSESVVLQPTEEESEIDISEWETYNNKKYGFELRYPQNWFIDEKKGDEILNPYFNLLEIKLSKKELSEYTSPSISINIVNENFVLGTRDWENFKIGQINGFITCYKESGCEIIFESNNNQSFYMVTENNPLRDKITNQILSTFKFLKD